MAHHSLGRRANEQGKRTSSCNHVPKIVLIYNMDQPCKEQYARQRAPRETQILSVFASFSRRISHFLNRPSVRYMRTVHMAVSLRVAIESCKTWLSIFRRKLEGKVLIFPHFPRSGWGGDELGKSRQTFFFHFPSRIFPPTLRIRIASQPANE